MMINYTCGVCGHSWESFDFDEEAECPICGEDDLIIENDEIEGDENFGEEDEEEYD